MTGVLRLSDDSFDKIVVKCCLRYLRRLDEDRGW
jgi:hypothetical protein